MDRTSQPPFHKSLAFNLPTPEKISHGSGDIFYLPSDVSKTVKIEFVFEAGRLYEPLPGIAQFTTQLLDKGIPGKNANQIANFLDYYGAHVEISTGFDFASIALYTLRKNVKFLLPLLISIISKPKFPEKELSSHQKIFAENLKVNLEKNSFIASNLIRKNIFKNHPYGKSIQLNDIGKIEVAHIKSFFNQYFQPYKIFIIGRIEDSDLGFLLKNVEPISKNVRNNNFAFHSPSPFKEIQKGPNQIQTSIKLGKRTIHRTHPDASGLFIANHILGGYFGSRLMKNIREEKGLTYGIHSSVQNLLQTTSLTITADVNSEKLEIAMAEIQKEIQSLPKIEERELEITKNHLIGNFQNDVTNIFAVGEKIKTIVLSNLSFDYYQKLINEINQIDLNAVSQICSKHFNVEEFYGVIVK